MGDNDPIQTQYVLSGPVSSATAKTSSKQS